MRHAGVVGLRLNVLYGGGLGFDALDATEALCLEMGWHLQFLLDARTLPGVLAMRLSRLRVPFVVDHMGHFPADVAEPGFQTLVSLVRDGAWVKLSGAYRLAPEPWRATVLLARALQHEVDHLNGVLFIDRMNSATKAGIAGRLKRMQRERK